jgi:carboxyl-terminal processing protease
MFFRKWLLPALAAMLANLFVASAAPLPPLASGPRDGQIAKQVARMLPVVHLLQTPLDEAMSARAWTNYLNMLDYDHSYLLQSDIDQFATNRFSIGDALRRGDVQFAYDVFNVYRQRVQERCAFATNLVAKGFDFTVKEGYDWKRKDAPWPQDRAAQDDLWRRRIKNEYLSFVIAREMDAVRATNQILIAATNRTVAPLATNIPALAVAATTNAAATNGVAHAPPPPTAEEFVSKRYEQFLIVLQDSDPEFVLSRYLDAVASAYDPHSEYMSPARMEDFNIDMSLSLCGIGAQLRSEDGAAKIEAVIPGGPAARDTRDIRLCVGDKIIGVGQGNGPIESILHVPLTQAVRKIRGAKDTKVVLNVISASDPSGASTRLVDLLRDEVKLEAQAATGHVERVTMPDGRERKLGVVRLPEFYGTMQQRPGTPGYRSAAEDVMRILGRLNSEQVEGLVLDLRNNGGGSLREAVELAGAFIRSGPVVQVREVRQVHVLPIPDTGPAVAFRRPVVVLLNRASASASEIVAGALQDYGRAVTVGDPQTHGKGSVQTILPLGDEKQGQLKVTTANYYRISGLSTQLRGVRPDIVIPSVFDTLDLGEDKLPNAMPWSCVPASQYTPVWDLLKWLPALRNKSAERLSKNPRYASYCRLVQHLRELNERATVPLEKKARLQMATSEREIQKLQNEELKVAEEPGAKDDVLLDESLHILSDFIDVSGGAEMPWEEKEDIHQQMLRMVGIGL